jgi:organic hydroperoxide reductase OsmC/OhrA
MHPYPHRYDVDATAEPEGAVTLRSEALPALSTTPPPQFGGPAGHWSPETLFVGAAADCFVLTFKAIAAASKLPWRQLDCRAEGVLDRRDGVVCFTELHLRAHLIVPAGVDAERARRLLEKAEGSCLITRSLALQPTLGIEVTTAPQTRWS